MKHVDKIINFLVRNEIFLHLNIEMNKKDYGITDNFKEKLNVWDYTPSKKHRRNCKDDLCYKNAKLEIIIKTY